MLQTCDGKQFATHQGTEATQGQMSRGLSVEQQTTPRKDWKEWMKFDYLSIC